MLAALLAQVVWEIELADGRKYSTLRVPQALREAGVRVNMPEELIQGLKTIEEIVRKLRPLAQDVEVVEGRAGGTMVRVRGYSWPVAQNEQLSLALSLAAIKELAAHLRLTVEYDFPTRTVRRVEFDNVTPRGGRLRLEPGRAELDPARLDPTRWITPSTEICR